jgi:hypothetical protein
MQRWKASSFELWELLELGGRGGCRRVMRVDVERGQV